VKYAFIKANVNVFSVIRLCQVMDVSQSAYYDWRKRPLSPRRQEDVRLTDKIKYSHAQSRENYGARRIRADLLGDGESISRTRVRRLMKQEHLEAKFFRKFKATTNSNHHHPVAPNLLARTFEVAEPNTVYAGDITYIPTDEGWLYLAIFIDLYSRAVVGCSMSNRMTAELVEDSLMMAVMARQPRQGLMVHSDRGSQYASDRFQKALHERGFVCSMSRKGNCWDNAPSESFFHTLKTELTHHRRYETREEARGDIFEYIEVFYNRQRRHSTIGYQAPMEFEMKH